MSEDIGTTTMTTPFRVDNWQVLPSDNQARHVSTGDVRSLEPRLMRLLCALATSPRRVVDRDSLIDAVWPKVIVNENSLTRAVSDLRKALHTDEVAGKKLIETVPKRGYRLMAEVALLPEQPPEQCYSETVESDDVATPDDLNTSNIAHVSSTKAAWQRWMPAMAASLLLIITAVIQLPVRMLEPFTLTATTEPEGQQTVNNPQADIIVGQPRVQARNALAEQSTLPATNATNSAYLWHGETADSFGNPDSLENATTTPTSAVLAPEGNLLAYVEHSHNTSRLMLRPTYNDAKPWTAFTTDETILQLQWSPLGDGILFTLQGTAAAGSQQPGHQYRRLMLLDIQSLALHELYRKDDSPAASANRSGNLT